MPATVEQIAQYLEGEVKGDRTLILEGFVPAYHPRAQYITFLMDIKQLPALEASDIRCIVVPKDPQSSNGCMFHPKGQQDCVGKIKRLLSSCGKLPLNVKRTTRLSTV